MDTKAKPKQSSQGLLVIWHGMNVRQLLRFCAHPPLLHWNKAHVIASLPLSAVYNSVLGLVERLTYGRSVARTEIKEPPLFVVGHWRSGTTLLHNLLSQDPRFASPNMYQCLFPNHFLLTERVVTALTARLVPESRPMDNLPAGWSIPQEEDIALAILTCLSPYMLMANPDRNDLARPFYDLALLSNAEREFFKREYLTLLKKFTLAGGGRQLVVKSPVNTYRIPLLLEMFPDAKFVCITRNPFDVVQSSLHLRKTMFRENTLGTPHLTDDHDAVYKVLEHAHRAYQRDKRLIPNGHLHEVKFEDLEQDPLGEMEQVYARLKLDGWEQLRSIIEPQVQSLRRYRKNQYRNTQAQLDECYVRLRRLFEEQGYPPPEAAPIAIPA